MSKPVADLPDAELELLAALCRAGEATAAELREALEPHRPMAHGSVLTLLGRLESKKLVGREKSGVGKAFIYKATNAGRSVFRPVVKSLVQRVFGGSSVSFVASLLESSPPSAEEIEELQQMLEDFKKKRSRR